MPINMSIGAADAVSDGMTQISEAVSGLTEGIRSGNFSRRLNGAITDVERMQSEMGARNRNVYQMYESIRDNIEEQRQRAEIPTIYGNGAPGGDNEGEPGQSWLDIGTGRWYTNVGSTSGEAIWTRDETTSSRPMDTSERVQADTERSEPQSGRWRSIMSTSESISPREQSIQMPDFALFNDDFLNKPTDITKDLLSSKHRDSVMYQFIYKNSMPSSEQWANLVWDKSKNFGGFKCNNPYCKRDADKAYRVRLTSSKAIYITCNKCDTYLEKKMRNNEPEFIETFRNYIRNLTINNMCTHGTETK